MTQPTSELKVTLDVNELTLDEVCLFSPGGFNPVALRTFLVQRTSWTTQEVGALQVKDLLDVFMQITDKIDEATVPLASAPRSSAGRAASRKHHKSNGHEDTAPQAGQTS